MADLGLLPDVLPARRADLEVAEFDTEYVVWDPTAAQVHRLQGLAAVLFDACDGSSRADELVAEIVALSGDEPDVVRQAVDDVWRRFHQLALLEGDDAVREPPCLGCGRQSLRPTPPRRRRWRR